MAYLEFLIKRGVYVLATLFLVSLIVFGVTVLLPGNVARMILGTEATAEAIHELEHQLGLDRPLLIQYTTWLFHIARGDLGESLRMQRPIGPILGERLRNSLLLAGVSLLIIAVGGIGVGVMTGVRSGGVLDAVVSTATAVGISLPEFVTGTVLLILFSGAFFNLLPPSGFVSPGVDPVGWLKHTILPAVTLAVILGAYVSRVTRASLVETLETKYIRTARLKGLPEGAVILKHALRNALIPTITVLFMNLGWLLGGIVIVEEVFVYPGIGRLTLFAISERDWPLIQACALVIAAAYCVGNLIADLLSLALDPRLREA